MVLRLKADWWPNAAPEKSGPGNPAPTTLWQPKPLSGQLLNDMRRVTLRLCVAQQ